MISLSCLLLIDIVNLFSQGHPPALPLAFPGVATPWTVGRSFGDWQAKPLFRGNPVPVDPLQPESAGMNG